MQRSVLTQPTHKRDHSRRPDEDAEYLRISPARDDTPPAMVSKHDCLCEIQNKQGVDLEYIIFE
jgi:hypothetical protein